MSYLQDFTPDQRELLISLPYRAGLWVSECDAGGGHEASEAELEVLESLITGFAEDYLKSEFVEKLMKETLDAYERWDDWARDLDTVPADCRNAIELMKEHLEPKDVLAFRQNIIEISVSVAMAYREEDEESGSGDGSFFTKVIDPFLSLVNKKRPVYETVVSPNISPAERQVLNQLSEALQVDWDGNPTDRAEAA